MEHIHSIIDSLFKVREQLARRRKALVPLAAVVVFATTYAMILPAVTLDDDTASNTPGIEVAKTAADETSASTAANNDSQGEQGENSGDSQDGDNSQGQASDDSQNDDNAGGSGDSDGSDNAGDAANSDNNAANGDNNSESSSTSDTVEGSEGQVEAETKGGDYKVTASYGSDAGFKDGTTLKVKELKSGSDDYQDAKDAVVAAKKDQDSKFKEDDLGFKALDISFYDADGNKVEPKGKVDIKIEAKDLPQKAAENGITVQHIVEKKAVEKAQEQAAESSDSDSANGSSSSSNSTDIPSAHGLVAQSVGGKTKVDGVKSGTAEFSVDSFSVYTITWSKSPEDDTRIGSVKVHYVISEGLEKDIADADAPSVESMSQQNGGVVKVSDWAKTIKADEDGTTYTFDHAVIGDRQKGATITAVKAQKDENGTEKVQTGADPKTYEPIYTEVTAPTYKLYYTTVADPDNATDSDWTLYKDSNSEQSGNDANIWMIYDTAAVTVHFMTLDGQPIQDAGGKAETTVIDGSSISGDLDMAEWATQNAPDGYRVKRNGGGNINDNSASASTQVLVADDNGAVTIGEAKGDKFRWLKYAQVGNDTQKYLYAGRGNRNYTSPGNIGSSADVYVTYEYTGEPMTVTFHHVDQYGAALAGDTSNTITVAQRDSGYVNSPNGWGNFSSSGYDSTGIVRKGNIGDWQYASYGEFHSSKQDGDADSTNQYGIYYQYTSNQWHSYKKKDGSVGSEEINSDSPSFVTDIYQVYTGKKGVTVHYVDESGKEIHDATALALESDNKVTPTDDTTVIDGYTYKDAHIGSYNGSAFTDITYTKNDDGSWTSAAVNGSDSVSADSPIGDVYYVYSKSGSTGSKTFNVHYKVADGTDSYSDAYYGTAGTDTGQTTSSFELQTGHSKNIGPDASDAGINGWSDIIHAGSVYAVSDNEHVSYIAARMGSVNGPEITGVSSDSNGNIRYTNEYTYTMRPSQEYPNRYTSELSASNALKGRTFTVTRDGNNYTLDDSQYGSFALNYANDAFSYSDQGGTSTHQKAYTATYRNGSLTIEYKLIGSANGNDSFNLAVNTYLASSNADIFLIYENGNSDEENLIWVKDDLKYSGLFRTSLSRHLTNEIEKNPNSVSYTWYRKVVDRGTENVTADPDNDTKVERAQSGGDGHFNIAYNSKDATSLDVEADEGAFAPKDASGNRIWTSDKDVYYYVQVSYTDSSGNKQTVQSSLQKLNYYGQLENGSFETPVVTTGSNHQYPNSDNEPNTEQDYKQSYASLGGVWHTTGLGADTQKADKDRYNYNGHDIEIVNANASSFRRDYSWQGTDGARVGSQFAELNCETAGALYQDVITHPNETMSYHLSHRARGNTSANPNPSASNRQYDSMYLVIMPTSVAMAGSSVNTELDTQTELRNFIQNHGGFDTSNPGREEDEITYKDDSTGVLIRKISSSNQDWHDIDVTNGYTAKGGLTRFFFVAAYTSSSNNTVGNFLDRVSFSQSLPEPDGFNLTVNKTITGLSQSQIASLAANNNQTNPLTFTITNTYTQSGQTLNNAALQNAKLQFNATQTGPNSYGFSVVALKSDGTPYTQNSPDNFTGNAVYQNGSLRLTWTFQEQSLTSTAPDGTYRYTVSESQDNISGYKLTPTYTLSSDNVTRSGTSGTINVRAKSNAIYSFTNAYSENTGDRSQITVKKVFSGVTDTTVEKLLNSNDKPYTVTLKKTKDSAGGDISPQPSIDLTTNTSGDVQDSTGQTIAVNYSEDIDQTNGKVTLTWVIHDPSSSSGTNKLIGGPGTYDVEETNYTPIEAQPNDNKDNNTLKHVTVNGLSKAVSSTESGSKITQTGIQIGKVGEVDYSPTINEGSGNGSDGRAKTAGVTPVTAGSTVEVTKDTNLIVAQTTDSASNRYIVWTPNVAGANLRQAIIDKINALTWTDGPSGGATLGNTSFRSGENPGAIKYNPTHGDATMTYDSSSGTLSFANETGDGGVAWSQYYATSYTLTGKEYGEDDSKLTNDDTEVSIANAYDPIIKIAKVAKGDANTPLAGATFRLYKGKGNDKQYYLASSTGTEAKFGSVTDVDTNSTETRNSDSTKALLLKTTLVSVDTTAGSSQEAIATIGALPKETVDTTYYLEEVTAPAGYNRVSDIGFTVKADGTVQLAGSNDDAKITWADPYYTITVSDSSGVELPSAGGSDDLLFRIAGIALVAVALAGAYVLRRRGYRGRV